MINPINQSQGSDENQIFFKKIVTVYSRLQIFLK